MTRSPFFIAITALRSAIFDLFFFGWVFAASIIAYAFIWLPDQRPFIKWARVWVAGVAFLERTLLGLNYKMEGKENLPALPYVVAMQHQSAWETCKLLLWFPNVAIVLKEELLHVPLWGPCMQHYGCIPVKRSKKPEDLKQFLTSARAMVQAGRAIVIYPQGTRTRPGMSSPYNKGVVVLQEELGLPIVPMTLNSGEFWARGAFLKYAGTINVQIHPPIPPGLPREEVMDRIKKLYEG
jgi:1-acyl-sn-glycerol-3-phosphate acyltransferase